MKPNPIFQAEECSRALFTPLHALAVSAALLAAPTASADIGYQFVTIGNPGNANDSARGSGAVSYTYDIGKYDVTLSQYTTFLNAVAQTDPYGLYNANMGTDANILGIQRIQHIVDGGSYYSYSVIGSGNRPVAYPSWFDAARFSNWLQNGQPTGLGEVAASTEQGAYTLNGDVSSGSETKNANALYWIPSDSEWYKAAFYDPNKGGPGAGGYWTYATKSDATPGNDATNPTLANQANYKTTVYSVSQSSSFPSGNALTDVGVFTNSASAYGTYDQNGDLMNWTDLGDGTHALDGGAWNFSFLNASIGASPNAGAGYGTGFRLASVAPTPEPTAAVSMIFAGGLLLSRRKRPSAL